MFTYWETYSFFSSFGWMVVVVVVIVYVMHTFDLAHWNRFIEVVYCPGLYLNSIVKWIFCLYNLLWKLKINNFTMVRTTVIECIEYRVSASVISYFRQMLNITISCVIHFISIKKPNIYSNYVDDQSFIWFAFSSQFQCFFHFDMIRVNWMYVCLNC